MSLNCLCLRMNPNYHKSIKLYAPFLQDFDVQFRTVHKRHQYFTWGLMSKFCLSPENVPLCNSTVKNLGRCGTGLSRNDHGLRVNACTCISREWIIMVNTDSIHKLFLSNCEVCQSMILKPYNSLIIGTCILFL